MRIERVWAMPNKWTFTIKPITQLLKEEMNGGIWIDPYAGMSSPATITNDINPNIPAKYHLDSLEFVKQFDDNSIDGALMDPPYSYRQISECYKSLGLDVDMHTTQSAWYFRTINALVNKIKAGGKVISFGWNSNGMANNKQFQKIRILLVAHGGHHNDTIVTVERKINTSLF